MLKDPLPFYLRLEFSNGIVERIGPFDSHHDAIAAFDEIRSMQSGAPYWSARIKRWAVIPIIGAQ